MQESFRAEAIRIWISSFIDESSVDLWQYYDTLGDKMSIDQHLLKQHSVSLLCPLYLTTSSHDIDGEDVAIPLKFGDEGRRVGHLVFIFHTD